MGKRFRQEALTEAATFRQAANCVAEARDADSLRMAAATPAGRLLGKIVSKSRAGHADAGSGRLCSSLRSAVHRGLG